MVPIYSTGYLYLYLYTLGFLYYGMVPLLKVEVPGNLYSTLTLTFHDPNSIPILVEGHLNLINLNLIKNKQQKGFPTQYRVPYCRVSEC